jgi:PTS system galactitol-specific IIB component
MDVERMTKDGNFDFVVSTAGTSLDVEIPVISGVPFLTGIGREQVFNQILEIINKN